MKLLIFPSYNEIFPNHEEESINDIISKVSSKEILKLLSRINRDLFFNRNDTVTSEKIFYDLCSNINELDRNSIIDNYNSFKLQKRRYDPSVIIFLEITILDLMIEVFRGINSLEYKESDKELLSITVLKGLLTCNSVYDRKLKYKFPSGIDPNSNFVTGIHQFGFSTPRDITYLINISSEFFKYLSSNSKLKIYLDEFLNQMQIDDYRKYINFIASASFQVLLQNNYRLSLNEYYKPELKHIFDSLSIDLSQSTIYELPINYDRDYKLLREKPILKIEDNTYCILDQNFLLDKLHIGLFFSIYYGTSLKNNKSLYDKFDNFLSDLGLDFAEKQLLYKIIPNCFRENSNAILVAGDKFQIEYSDYYVRENDSLFLFEFKNYIINADVKNSLDFDKIYKAIVSKTYEEEVRNKKGEVVKIKSKGVKQLANTINQINKGGFEFDLIEKSNQNKLYVYPILVYTDEFFNVEGMHEITDKYYNIEISNITQGSHQINRLILISLYDLIRVSYTINKRKIPFAYLLDLYHERLKHLTILSRAKSQSLIIDA
ncbi:hypothetical protein [Spirosoma aerolatum]|uniref:hypothetical protein n=1 Tax=Spirosoma aerolatum TaxID=1211326 RepID=UPI0009ADBF6E|nr:hypothetical protein [Spirosoma aerolatum]